MMISWCFLDIRDWRRQREKKMRFKCKFCVEKKVVVSKSSHTY
jgi:hypothetical protein